jgi:5-guanidino-2-oxopentanoate decarboxylase
MRPLGVELAAMLAERGVDTVFGIPGVHNIELYRGIEDAGIRHVLARHEQGAGFMADGYARATGQPGVCFVISGPGLTNVMTPMAQAYSDSVPVLVISTVLDEVAATRGQLHQMRDQEGAARCLCAWSETARTADAAYSLVDRALVEFQTGRARPRHIQVPIAVLGAAAGRCPPPPARPVRASVRSDDLGGVASDLSVSRRPLFIFGGGAVGVDADALLAATGAASFTTYAGSGIVGAETPLYFGSNLTRPGSAEVIGSADLVVAVGTELADTDLGRRTLAEGVRLIRVDIDPEMLADGHGAKRTCLADAGAFVSGLLDLCRRGDVARADGWGADEASEARARWRMEVDAERPGIAPVCDALKAALPRDVMIYSDMTQFAYVAKDVWDMPVPGHWHHPYGFGTLGYALPAAIGGALGHDGPVLAIAGDYGFQYTIQELGTAVELGLSLPILLWDNDALAEIRDCMVAAQIAPNAVHARNPDWGLLAKAYGCGYAEPDSLDALCAAIKAGFGAGRPTIIRATPELAG